MYPCTSSKGVAPLAGAWIEIPLILDTSLIHHQVAPLAGAWIEILIITGSPSASSVAPLAGAWIEIIFATAGTDFEESRSPRGSVD